MRLLYIALACLINVSVFCQTDDARVLIIGIDGLRSDCLESSDTPAIDALISEGLFSPDALNNDITYSGPGWSGMICGVWSDKHGVTNNFIGSNFDDFPSYMKRIELENTNLTPIRFVTGLPLMITF